MKKLVLAVFAGAVVMSLGRPAVAEPPRFTVNWRFEVKFGDGVQTYNENADIIVPVRIPREFGWECNRNTPVLVDDRSRASFACTNDGWKTNMLIMTGCRVGGADPMHTAALRLFSARADGKQQGDPVDGGGSRMGKWIDLTVACETVAAR